MSRRAVIVQPCVFPWRGQFDLFSRADIVIFLDTVQYSSGSWYNRNRIMGAKGPTWITVPVITDALKTLIKDKRVAEHRDWRQKIKGQFHQAYARAAHFHPLAEDLERFLDADWVWISELARASVLWSLERLGREIDFLVASRTGVDADDPVERLIRLCRHVGADTYLSGPAAKEYIGAGLPFADAGIRLEWMSYPEYPRYRQVRPYWDSPLSILDLLVNEGPEAARYVWPSSSAPPPGSEGRASRHDGAN